MSIKTKAATETVKREGVLAEHVRTSSGPFNAGTLARSYGLPVLRGTQIIARNGGGNG